MNTVSHTEPLENYCGTTYAARLLGLSVGTIQSLVEKNELHAWKTQGGHRRISMPSIREYQRKHNMPVTMSENSHQRLRVLVVDDDPVAREMLRGLTSRTEIPVDCTVMSSGLEALIDIASIQPDVLIADLNMPGVDGFELLRTLRNNSQFTKMSCLAVSALSQEEITARGGLPEGVIFMPKPLSMNWLNGFFAAIVATRQSEPMPSGR
jgi:excisionase family DNA binding protein